MKILSTIRKNRILTSTTASLVLIGFYFIQAILSWPGLQSSGVKAPTNYIDQQSILNSANCFRNLGNDVYRVDVIPSNCGGFQYSVELLRFLNLTHITSLHSYTLGIAFMCLTIAIFSFLLFLIRNQGKVDNIVTILALTSPGIWLLFERGNYDSLIYIFILAGLILLKSKFQEIGILFIAATVLMKFYTLPLFCISILMLRHKTSRLVAVILSIPLTTYVLLLIKQVATFPSTWYVSFGIKSAGLYLEFLTQEKIWSKFVINPGIANLIGFVILGLICKLLLSIEAMPSFVVKSSVAHEWAKSIFVGTEVVFLSCFFAGMNFDYRLIYPATLIAISSIVLTNNRFRSLMTASGIGAIWLSTYSFGLHGIPALIIQLIGDCLLYLFTASQLLLIYYQSQTVYAEIKKENSSSGLASAITLLRSKA